MRVTEFQREIIHLIDAVESDTMVGSERIRLAQILRAATKSKDMEVLCKKDDEEKN